MEKLVVIITLLLTITPEAQAIATCESGDTVNIGTIDYTAVNVNRDGTIDTGAWQFNSYWVWSKDNRWAIIPLSNGVYEMTSTRFLGMYPTAADAPPDVQYAMFQQLWNDGYGWRHWSASKPCWDQWLVVRNGQAVWE